MVVLYQLRNMKSHICGVCSDNRLIRAMPGLVFKNISRISISSHPLELYLVYSVFFFITLFNSSEWLSKLQVKFT